MESAKEMNQFVQQLLNGITLGCIYGLLALSYTLIFGVLRAINFAIGEAMMLGAFAAIGAIKCAEYFGLSASPGWITILLALGASISVSLLFSLLTELIAFRPLMRYRGTSILLSLISSLGVAIFAQNLVLHFVDSGNVNFPVVIMPFTVIFTGARITETHILIVVGSLALMMAVSYIVYRTNLGRKIRAVRDNQDLASEYGTNPKRIIIATFALSGVLAGFAGLSIGMYYGVARYSMGFAPGIKAFSAAILGGIGDVIGGVVGGILIGLVETFSAGYISAENKDVIVFFVLILVLLFRPRGILGRGVER